MSDQKNLEAFGRHLAKLRRSKGYSQDRLILEAGFSRGTLSKIENGLVNPKLLTLVKIAEVLGVSIKSVVDFQK